MRRGSGLGGRAHREIRARSFGSGRENPCGLHVRAREVEGGFRATYRPQPHHAGFPQALHGGITAALLDEVMAYPASRPLGRFVATRELHVWYDRPVPMDRPIVIDAWLESAGADRFVVAGELCAERGRPLARGRAVYRRLPDDRVAAFLGPRATRRVVPPSPRAARPGPAAPSAKRRSRAAPRPRRG